MSVNQETYAYNEVANMRMLLRWMCVKTKKDKLKNEHFQEHLGKASIGVKIRETCLKHLEMCPRNVQRTPITTPARKSSFMQVDGHPRKRGNRMTWIEVVTIDMK